MRPWDAEVVEFDDANESELARHGITPSDVVAMVEHGPAWVPNKKHRAGDWKAIGRTTGGRMITVVVRVDAARRTLRPITGWPTTSAERNRHGQR